MVEWFFLFDRYMVCGHFYLKKNTIKIKNTYRILNQVEIKFLFSRNISGLWPFLFFPFFINAQDSLTVTKNFRFNDGVYMSFKEFQADRPAYTFEDVEMRWHTNPQNFLTQVESISDKKNGAEIPMENIWGMCMDGIPFVHLPDGEIKRQLPAFAALKLRGKICYYTYPDWRMKTIPILAYNPLTGYPYMRGTVEREERLTFEKILHFETGEIKDFTVDNFLSWINDDEDLMKTINGLPPNEQKEKLFKCLLIYVDRNETRLVIGD